MAIIAQSLVRKHAKHMTQQHEFFSYKVKIHRKVLLQGKPETVTSILSKQKQVLLETAGERWNIILSLKYTCIRTIL